jgi:hypothetical protein
VRKKTDASRNPQNFRAEIEAIQTNKPIKVSTEAEMNALLELETTPVGGIYKYTGEPTEAYKHYHLYKVLEWEKGGKYFKHLPITAGTLDNTTNGEYDVEEKLAVDVKVPDNPKPIEVGIDLMNEVLLETSEVGSIYKYVGSTFIYEKDTLYEVREDSEGNKYFEKLVAESEKTLPEISSADAANALEVGTVFKYVGETTEAFENGAYYVVEESE